MFVAAVLSFAAGIYLEASRPFPLAAPALFLLILPFFIPFLIKRKQHFALCVMILLFMCAGIIRLGIVSRGAVAAPPEDGRALYEGLVIESSPATKTMEIEKPADLKGVKAIFRTDGALKINDRIKVFGHMREMDLTFNNPGLISWKWMKRLEGVCYEIKGTLVSAFPGTNYIHAWREMLARKIDASGARNPGILKALTIGDMSGVNEATKSLFAKTGTSHILAISGSNIGIVTAFFFFIARTLIRRSHRLRLRGDDIRFAALLSIPFAILFMLTAGSSIPTIRATIMITVFMIALFFERGKHMINTIALSALVVLLIYPHSLFSPSFQLTFMSVLFIVICTERFHPLLRIENRVLKWLASSVLMTIAAMIGTLPIVIYHFFGINPFSVAHNLIAIPPMCIAAMPMSLAGLILPWGEVLLRFSGEIVAYTIVILEHMNVGYIYPIIRPTVFECALYFSFALSLIFINVRLVSACLIFVLIPFSAGYTYHAYQERFHNKTLCVSLLDVGLGDAILLEAPEGFRILMDGGGQTRGNYDIGKSIITPILLSKKIRTLDYVVNTHPHGDHAGGLFHILQSFRVRHFATGAYFGRESRFIEMLALLTEKGIPLEIWQKGERIRFSDKMTMEVLNPPRGISTENPNNASLVLRAVFGNSSFLFTGDIDREVEERLVMDGTPLRSDVLKVPHHGSRFSSSPAFVRSVKPFLAVLSVGKGIRGLPGDDALMTYKSLSVPLLRTDRNGFIRVCSDGERITCASFRE